MKIVILNVLAVVKKIPVLAVIQELEGLEIFQMDVVVWKDTMKIRMLIPRIVYSVFLVVYGVILMESVWNAEIRI